MLMKMYFPFCRLGRGKKFLASESLNETREVVLLPMSFDM